MSSSDPIVVWIFDRLALDVALAGDLREERAHGRSTIWYCRQELIAICIGIWGPIFHHKVLALRALATGCAVNAVWLLLNPAKFLHIGLTVWPEISFASIATLLIILLTQIVTGWVVARTHRRYPVPMVLVFVTWLRAVVFGQYLPGQNSFDGFFRQAGIPPVPCVVPRTGICNGRRSSVWSIAGARSKNQRSSGQSRLTSPGLTRVHRHLGRFIAGM
jgi:hypothetical protein